MAELFDHRELQSFVSRFGGNEDRIGPLAFNNRIEYLSPPMPDHKYKRAVRSTSSHGSQSTRSSCAGNSSGESSYSPYSTTTHATSLAPSTNQNQLRRQQHRPPDTVGAIESRISPNESDILPCEFGVFGYRPCNQVFKYNETEAWIDHIASEHLRDQLPAKCICWYCDTWEFEAASFDPRTNFELRMQHIRGHILEERLCGRQIRPDYHFVEHLYQQQLISQAAYQIMCKMGEGHQIDGIFRYDFIPPERRRAQECDKQVMVNDSRRHRRRHL